MAEIKHTLKSVLQEIQEGGCKRVFVTGPQRSGTHIASKILALELDFAYIPEKKLSPHNFYAYLSILDCIDIVVQAPALCHRITDLSKEVHVIFMLRPLSEILESQRKLNWIGREEQKEKKKYTDRKEFYGSYNPNTWTAEIKRDVYFNYQKERLLHSSELVYHSLSVHSYWLAPNRRRK